MKRFKNWIRKKILSFLLIELTTTTITVVNNEVDMDAVAKEIYRLARIKRAYRV